VSAVVSKITAVGNFQQLFDSLDPDPRIKGRQFEEICKWYLENDPTRRDLVAKVWLWSEWEHAWGIDAGIDLVVEDVDGHLWAVQSKAYDPAYSVSKSDVDKFLSESSRKQFSYRLLIATTDKLHHIARKTINAQEKHVGFIGRADLLTAALDWPKSPAVLRPAKPRKPAKPHDYQRDAIKDVVEGFATADRGQLIMACGTGKTLTSLFIKEKLAAERTLVLLPSLSLLKQTLSEWKANATTPFRALPVCSDESVTDSQDEPVAHASELGLPDVTTDPAAIAEFLRRPGPRVVFSTYQSSPQIAAAFALGGVPEFDLAFADEAHRVAGDESTVFATILDADLIKAKRRLFMTATPRYYTGRVIKAAKKSKDSEMVVASMDDHTKFGEVFHKLSFGAAISLGRLTDYQVAVIAVDTADETYREMAENGALLKRDGKKTDGHILASQIGLAKAMRKYNLRRLISFHSSIARARGFAAEIPEVIDWMPKRQRPSGPLWTGVATGEMTAGERHLRLQRLRNLEDGERGLLTNARCLSEGVDVPTLDGVAFIDPKGSEVDIIQAVGRAIRLADDKTIGTIVIPVYIDSTMDPDAALNDSSFKTVWRVVKALRAHDEDLAEQIDAIRREMGRGGKPRVPDKIRLDVPATVGKEFADAFDVRLVEQTAASWEFWFALLEQYIAEHGDARVAQSYSTGKGDRLGLWVTTQRKTYQSGRMDPERLRRLEASHPSWSWDALSDNWEKGFRYLLEYIAQYGNARVPTKLITPDGYKLGSWVARQRILRRRGNLSPEYERRLEECHLTWSWDAEADRWEAGFSYLLEYLDQHGDLRVPHSYTTPDGYRLGLWSGNQRGAYRSGKLDPAKQKRLEEAHSTWSWDVLSDWWEEGFSRLLIYIECHGNARVPDKYSTEDSYPLGKWVQSQLSAYRSGKLDPERLRRLEEVHPTWSWDNLGDRWEDGFSHLTEFIGQHGHARVPYHFKTSSGYPLGQWVARQRRKRPKGQLDPEHESRLRNLPSWVWSAFDAAWEEHFYHLLDYVALNGDCRVPPGHKTPDGFRLGRWVERQRRSYASGDLSSERRQRLEALPGWS
jgi:superfamily II DNA or RNA helicase